MKLGNLLSKVLPTKKSGTKGNAAAASGGQVSYFVQFSNLEDNPIYELNDSLSIGSEAGDVILDDPSLSPKHCTIFLNQGVVSVVDHNSQEGTFVSEHQIPAGKMVLLKDDDFIRAGELELDVVVQETEPSELMSAPDRPAPSLQAAPTLQAAPDAATSNPDSTQEIAAPDLDTPSTGGDELSLDDGAGDELSLDIGDELSLDIPADDLPADDLAAPMTLDKTGELDVPDDLSLDNAEEEAIEDLSEEGEALPDEAPAEKKPGLFARLFKRKKKEVVEEEVIEEKPKEDKVVVEKAKTPKRGLGNRFGRGLAKSKMKAKKDAAASVEEIEKSSANALSRTLAFGGDLLIADAAFIILEPVEKSWEYYQLITEQIVANYDKFIKPHVWTHIAPHIDKVPKMVWDLIKDGIPYIGVLYLFIALRVVANLGLGVSFGQFLLGIRANGNAIWNRVGGALRVVLGVLLLPLIALDFLVLFGKRSMKEAITFTRVQINSKLAFFSGVLIGFPLIVALFIISPMFKGGKLPPVIALKADKAIAARPKSPASIISNYFKLKFFIANQMPYTTYPSFELILKNGSKVVLPTINFYSQDIEESIKLTKYKSFRLAGLFKLAAQSDPLLEKKFPLIKKYVSDPSQVNNSFKKIEFNAKEKEQFNKEIQEYIAKAFSLDIKKLVDHVKDYGPFIKGYVDVRDELKRLSGIDALSEISIKKIGANNFLILAEYGQGAKAKVKVSYFPLDATKATVNQVSMSVKAYKDKALEDFEAIILANTEVIDNEVDKVSAESKGQMNAVEIFDFYFSNFTLAQKQATLGQFERLLFENAAKSVKLGDVAFTEILKKDIRKLIKVFGVLQEQAVKKMNEAQKQQIEETYNRLIQKLSEILNALEERNLDYFGATIKA